jgi:hypothetical protein
VTLCDTDEGESGRASVCHNGATGLSGNRRGANLHPPC